MKHLTTVLLTLLVIAGCSEYSNETECKLKEMQKCDGSRNCELAASDYCRDEYKVVEKPKKKTPEEIKKEEEQRLALQKKQEEIAKQQEIKRKEDEERRILEEKRQAAFKACSEENIHNIFCLGGPESRGSIDNAFKCERNMYVLIKEDRWTSFNAAFYFSSLGYIDEDINTLTFKSYETQGSPEFYVDRETLVLSSSYSYYDEGECELMDTAQAEKEIRNKIEEKKQATKIKLQTNKI